MAALTALMAISTASSLHEGRMASKKAKGIAEQEQRDLAKAEKQAKAERLEKIKGQRAQMGLDSAGFGGVSSPVGGMLNQGETLG